MNPDLPAEISASAQALAESVRRIAAGLPPEIWTATTGPTYFRIRANRAEPVADDYAGEPGDLVFCYRNDAGFISIVKTYPADPAR